MHRIGLVAALLLCPLGLRLLAYARPALMRRFSLVALLRAAPAVAPLALLLIGCRTTAPPPGPVVSPPVVPVVVTAPPTAPEEAPIEKDEAYRPVPPGVLVSTSYYPQTAVTEWRLTNGARLVLRPLQAAPRQVALLAVAPGGFAAVPDSLAAEALALSDGDAGFATSLMARETVVQSAGSAGALAALFEQVGEAMEAPRLAPARRPSVEEALFAAQAGLPPVSTGAEAQAARMLHDRLFDDPRRFTFVLVGDVSPAAVASSAAALARLRPSQAALLTPVDSSGPVRLPERAERWTLPADRGASGTAVAFRGAIEPSYDALAGLDVLAVLLEEALDGAARVTAAVYFDAGIGEIRVVAEGDDGAERGFEEALFEAVRELRADPPSARAVAAARGQRGAAHEASLETAEGWLDALARTYRYDQDTREVLAYPHRLRGVAAERVHRLARAVLDPERYVLVRRPGS